MAVERDKHGQLARDWTEKDYQLLDVLEEVSGPVEEDDNRSFSVFMADIYDIVGVV